MRPLPVNCGDLLLGINALMEEPLRSLVRYVLVLTLTCILHYPWVLESSNSVGLISRRFGTVMDELSVYNVTFGEVEVDI